MDLASGRIVTFYSYKGGTGRSMALANFAWILAANGKRVLAIDWDLEAPGLHRYFRPFLADPDLLETDGLIDTFWSLASVALANAPAPAEMVSGNYRQEWRSASGAPQRGGPAFSNMPELVDALGDSISRLRCRPLELQGAAPDGSGPSPTLDLSETLKIRLKEDFRKAYTFPTGGYLDFLGAGRQGATYSERVNTFDWKRFYELGGADFFDAAKSYLREQYDWVLIDSRTGVSDTSGICTIQMPDTVVPCFTLNRQSIDGVAAVLGSIRGHRSETVDGSDISFFPVATRIENAEQRRLERARRYARAALAEFLPSDSRSRTREYWDQMEIAYRPAYAFEEVLAAFGDATGAAGAADSMAAQMEALSRRIAGDERLSMPEITEADRSVVLAKYMLEAEPPRGEDQVQASEAELGDSDFGRGLRAKEQLWRQSQFDWRLLLSRRELELLTNKDREEFGRNMSYYVAQSEKIYAYLRITDLMFVVIFVSAGVFAWLSVEWLWRNTNLIGNESQIVVSGIFAFVGLIEIISIIASAILSRAPGRPHGLKLIQLLRFIWLGPFRSEIEDYNPKRNL